MDLLLLVFQKQNKISELHILEILIVCVFKTFMYNIHVAIFFQYNQKFYLTII